MNADHGCQWFSVLYNGVIIVLPRGWLCGLVLMSKTNKNKQSRSADLESDMILGLAGTPIHRSTPCAVNASGMASPIFAFTLEKPQGIVLA